MVEINLIAAELLGLAAVGRAAARGRDLREWLTPEARDPYERLLEQVREHGSAPAVLLELRGARAACLMRASRISPDEPVLLQASLPAAEGAARMHPAPPGSGTDPAPPLLHQADLIERSPDGHVILDRTGRILRANAAFVEMAQTGTEAALLGESFGRWLRRPGADLTVLLANVERFGTMRLFATRIVGDLDSEIEVELSATGNGGAPPELIGVTLRDVGRRLPDDSPRPALAGLADALAGRIGRTPLRTLVEEAVAEVERTAVQTALEMTDGNRTAAAQLLGISRQSLHAKLLRHGTGEPAAPAGAGGGTANAQ
jgi:transcriptional regulator PpsR